MNRGSCARTFIIAGLATWFAACSGSDGKDGKGGGCVAGLEGRPAGGQVDRLRRDVRPRVGGAAIGRTRAGDQPTSGRQTCCTI